MATSTKKQEIFDYVNNMLGGGMVDVELDPAHYETAINKSLTALGDVIAALTTGSKHIPYRNHPLTMLMSDSLGGNAKTLMFVNISPLVDNVDESLSSLQYASRVKKVSNKYKTAAKE